MITITGKGKGKPKVFIRCINELIYVTTVVALYDCTLDDFTFLFMQVEYYYDKKESNCRVGRKCSFIDVLGKNITGLHFIIVAIELLDINKIIN